MRDVWQRCNLSSTVAGVSQSHSKASVSHSCERVLAYLLLIIHRSTSQTGRAGQEPVANAGADRVPRRRVCSFLSTQLSL